MTIRGDESTMQIFIERFSTVIKFIEMESSMPEADIL
jgi:hypothetical protein